jgi:hypothetical protein
MTKHLPFALGALTMAIVAALIALAGCASTLTTTSPDGVKTDMRVGFGNRIVSPPLTIEPSPVVVSAGERVLNTVAARASDEILARAVDGATSNSR